MTAGPPPRSTPLRLDLENAWVWQGEQCWQLPPKAFAVLRYLIEHAGRLVSKDELLHAVWPDTVVSEWALTTCMREIRKALGEKAQAPQYIETVHRRGYRFIGKVASSQYPVVSRRSAVGSPQLATDHWQLTIRLVGRDTELAQLHNWLDKALNGERQIVFVTGEPGIGKTTVVEAFLVEVGAGPRACPLPGQPQGVAPTQDLWITRGQCIEHYGAGEAYLPVLEALGRLCREPGGERFIELLSQQAPTWLVQMPALLDAVELESLQRKTVGATRERMLRELAEALEALTLERPLVLWLEDLHWSDASTLEWLAFVARRREPARVLILGSYRPVEMLSDGQPLKRVLHELYAHDLGQELALGRFSESEVSAYLRLRFPESVLPTRLEQVLQQRTGGNPLFLASIVQDLLNQRVILQEEDGRWEFHGNMAEVEKWTPESVRHLLARQRERLAPDEQRVLEAASLAGLEFSAAAVAAALETKVVQVEDHCGRLAEQQQFLRLAGISEWPDGTRAGRYGFLHALYQEFWHEWVSVGKQQQWHRRMGERKEAAYGQQVREIAAELAVHFEQGGDYRRAVRYLQLAGENAVWRNAHREAISHITNGLNLLRTHPATPERAQEELALQMILGGQLIITRGYAAREVGQAVTRARELCQQLGETSQLFPVLWRLFLFYLVRGELQTARELAERLMRLAQSLQDPYLLSVAHKELGVTLYWLGELTSARPHLEQAIALYDPQQHPCHTVGTADPRVDGLSYAAWTLWDLGYPEQALKRSQEAVALAEGLSHPFSLAYALGTAARFHLLRREEQVARERAEAAITLSTEQGFPFWLARGMVVRGAVLAEQGQVEEGLAQMHQGLAAYQATGTESGRSYSLVLLAAAYAKVGRREEGLTVLAEALAAVDRTGERVGEAELYRLKGTLTLQSQANPGQVPGKSKTSQGKSEVEKKAEECFWKAIEIARRQEAKSLELRAVMSLARLWRQQGKKEEAHKMLVEIYGWFTEGFDTKDLQEARALLEELS